MDCLMYKAAREGNVEFLKQFIQGSDNNLLLPTHRENNIVHIAAKLGHETFVREALQASPFLASHKNSKGDTPLHVAARAGHAGVVKLLLSTKSSLFRVDSIETPGTTVLREMEVGKTGAPKLWRTRNMVQSTALHEALRNGHEEVAVCLWELHHEMAGLVNSAGESPLYLAAESRCKEVLLKILKFLTQVSYNPTLLREAVRGPDGQNPLHAAILSGSSGLLTLSRKAFHAFVLADSLAMCSSMTVVFLLILAMVGDPAFLRSAIFYSTNLLNIALFGTLVAFVTGLYTVISPKSEWLAIIVVVICSSVPFLIKFLHRKSSTSNPLVIKYLKGTMKKPVITYSPGRRRSNLSYGYSKAKSPHWYQSI
ncbi:hypothetical protein Patl1_04353 [Pistacia atlantica]|uniref:Uncharacterized protein n=1 Tax=Pistacia atlantica TaxID=434234 RepID=A0ACC1BRU8_9ROSI|nr:hypothetical protein Patl1_04353 [Pistacia atlantica]